MISVSHCCWRMELLVALFLIGGKQFRHPEDVPVIWEGSITGGKEVGVQVLLSGAEDLARTVCSTFPHTKMKHGSEFFTKRPKFLSSLRRNLGIFKKIPDCFGSFRNSSVCFGCFDIGSKHRNKPKKIFFGFTKQTETLRETDLVSVCFGSNRNFFSFISRTP
jgi:hypothetical protein